MKALVRRLHSPDVVDLPGYCPVDPEVFGFLLQVMIGPDGSRGEESFDITVCSPRWLLQRYTEEDVIIGHHHLIMLQYNYDRLARTIERFCADCEALTWNEVARKLARLGRWEFEDYAEAPLAASPAVDPSRDTPTVPAHRAR